ncbi:DUF4184 family protein [Pontibacter pamirensis]|uniref:DUF4184 family protein n=1 Tax=Pontibacter pamirensis TaxID=2562824 RepID=UPI0013894787|nr:DUF4184 family protein [Pontibacter pamirensis]
MPFTFSHPAIVLPFKAIKPAWFSTTGLVVGSIAPDLVYFLKMGGSADFGHTLAGVIILDLPLSFLLAIAFHLWVRNILILHLPAPLDKKHSDYLNFDFLLYLKKHWLLFFLSVAIGVFSHLFWDDFSKPDGFVYYFAPAFFSQKIHVGPLDMQLYTLIERTGSAVGLAFLVWVVCRKRLASSTINPHSFKRKFVYWLCIFMVMAIAAAVKLLFDKEGDSVSYYVVVLTSAGVLSFVFVTVLALLLDKKVKQTE